jgi:hypothetical protein
MLVNLDAGLLNVFNPMPNWLRSLIEYVESFPRMLWNKLLLLYSTIVEKISGKTNWIDFAKALFPVIFDWSLPPTPLSALKHIKAIHITDDSSIVKLIELEFDNLPQNCPHGKSLKYGSGGIFSREKTPFTLSAGEFIKTVRYLHGHGALAGLQLVSSTGRTSQVYGKAASTFQSFEAPFGSTGIVGFIFAPGKGVGQLTGVVLQSGAGNSYDYPLPKPSDVELVSIGADGPIVQKGGCCSRV